MPPDDPAGPLQVLSGVGWLDTHFEACRAEYEAGLRSVGVQPGWRVLDAGCGSGSFLPLLTDLVGATGRVVAMDVSPENVAAVQHRVAAWALACPVESQEGSVTALPFEDSQFDALWCSNTLQYLDEDELGVALWEFRRVVRPGGVVAVKDVDMQLLHIAPADPFLVGRLCEAGLYAEQGAVQSRGSLRGRHLRRWLERAGLVNVWQRTTLIERWAPLRVVERQLWAEWLTFLARVAEERGVWERDRPAWHVLRDPSSLDHPLNDPEFYACEGQVVAVGRVPTGG